MASGGVQLGQYVFLVFGKFPLVVFYLEIDWTPGGIEPVVDGHQQFQVRPARPQPQLLQLGAVANMVLALVGTVVKDRPWRQCELQPGDNRRVDFKLRW